MKKYLGLIIFPVLFAYGLAVDNLFGNSVIIIFAAFFGLIFLVAGIFLIGIIINGMAGWMENTLKSIGVMPESEEEIYARLPLEERFENSKSIYGDKPLSERTYREMYWTNTGDFETHMDNLFYLKFGDTRGDWRDLTPDESKELMLEVKNGYKKR